MKPIPWLGIVVAGVLLAMFVGLLFIACVVSTGHLYGNAFSCSNCVYHCAICHLPDLCA